MSQSAAQIVHESEAQRQYVRVRLPAKVTLNGDTYALRDLSSGGLAIVDVKGSFEKGQVLSLDLALPFQDFTLDSQLEAQVQNYDASAKTVGVRFINLTKQQISLLNHVIKSFIAGDVVDSSDILNVVARDNFVRVRRQDGATSAAPQVGRQILPLLFIVLLGLIGAYIIGNSVYQSAFIVKASDGVVEGTVLNFTSTATGVYQSSLTKETLSIKPGDVIGTIQQDDGMSVPLTSACECFVFSAPVKTGQRVATGETLMTLVPVDGKQTVKIRIDNSSVQRLKMTSIPTISIAGDDIDRSGRIVEIKSSLAQAETAAPATAEAQLPYSYIVIQPDQKIPADMIGRPAQVEFKTP